MARSLSTQKFGTTSTSIQTTSSSDLPPSKYISGTDNTGLSFCEKLGTYSEATPCPVRETYFDLDDNFLDLKLVSNRDQGNQKGDGWRFNVIRKDWSTVVPGAPQTGGYLFIYFHTSYERNKCRDFLPDRRVGGVCSNVESGKPNSRDYNQGKIFAVVISNISQINALNRTFSYQINGSYLSTTINSVINTNFTLGNGDKEFYVRNFINDIRKNNNNDTTPIISPIPNPIQSNGNTFDINFNSYTIYPTEYQSTSIYINLKDLVTSGRFVNGLMGSGKFVVLKLSGISGEFTGPWSQFVYYYRPKIVTSSYNPNEEILSIFDDVAAKQLYVQIMKPAPLSSNAYYQAVTLDFTLRVLQPGEVHYMEKSIELKFRVTF